MQENNFKAVLESIRDLMNEDTVMPDWLHDIFLGYGDPAQAKYTHMPTDQLLQTIDFKVHISNLLSLSSPPPALGDAPCPPPILCFRGVSRDAVTHFLKRVGAWTAIHVGLRFSFSSNMHEVFAYIDCLIL